MDIYVEALNNCHARSSFDCGVKELNEFLAKYARQNQKNNMSKTFVAVHDDLESETAKEKEISGFYTLCSGQISSDFLPDSIKHPGYPVSIARLARIAVDVRHQGEGVGASLLYDALIKIRSAAELMGIFAVVVDAKNEAAKLFYKHYNFIELQELEQTLFLPMSVINKL